MMQGDGSTKPTAPLVDGTLERVRVRNVTIQVLSGPDAGSRYVSRGERTVIGTDRSASFVITDPTVSRFHCEIAVSEGKVTLRDLGSRNGTRLAGASIKEVELAGDVTLKLGQTEVAIRLGAADVEIPISSSDRFGRLVGRSVGMRAAFALFERAAQSDVTVLLQGETGTGKDLAAESIHDASARSEQPFVPVDCSAIPAPLLESELFGVERGAFTGADASRPGAFVEASGGTLLLDEIGELGIDMQPKLLRVLETRRIRPVGRGKVSAVDVRIVAATNRDLRAAVSSGAFRSDLYYRLAVLEIRLPPLRERLEDLPLLVDDALASLGASDTPVARLLRSPATLAQLARHDWPGNVRELRNYVERSLTLDGHAPLDPSGSAGAPFGIDTNEPLRLARERHVREFERRYLEKLLQEHGNNVARAARAAGVARVHLHRLLTRAKLR